MLLKCELLVSFRARARLCGVETAEVRRGEGVSQPPAAIDDGDSRDGRGLCVRDRSK